MKAAIQVSLQQCPHDGCNRDRGRCNVSIAMQGKREQFQPKAISYGRYPASSPDPFPPASPYAFNLPHLPIAYITPAKHMRQASHLHPVDVPSPYPVVHTVIAADAANETLPPHVIFPRHPNIPAVHLSEENFHRPNPVWDPSI